MHNSSYFDFIQWARECWTEMKNTRLCFREGSFEDPLQTMPQLFHEWFQQIWSGSQTLQQFSWSCAQTSGLPTIFWKSSQLPKKEIVLIYQNIKPMNVIFYDSFWLDGKKMILWVIPSWSLMAVEHLKSSYSSELAKRCRSIRSHSLAYVPWNKAKSGGGKHTL